MRSSKYTPRKYPYWKIQVWDNKLQAWRDIQKTYPDITVALKACPTAGRLMQVERNGRFPLNQRRA